jgi:TonB family protein
VSNLNFNKGGRVNPLLLTVLFFVSLCIHVGITGIIRIPEADVKKGITMLKVEIVQSVNNSSSKKNNQMKTKKSVSKQPEVKKEKLSKDKTVKPHKIYMNKIPEVNTIKEEKVKKSKKPEKKAKRPKITYSKQTDNDSELLKEGFSQRKISAKSSGDNSFQTVSENTFDKENYLDKVREIIKKNTTYPAVAKRRGIQGTVKVSFRILRNGSIDNVKVTEKSEFGILNDAALQAVRASSPFDKPEKIIAVEIPVSFRLK